MKRTIGLQGCPSQPNQLMQCMQVQLCTAGPLLLLGWLKSAPWWCFCWEYCLRLGLTRSNNILVTIIREVLNQNNRRQSGMRLWREVELEDLVKICGLVMACNFRCFKYRGFIMLSA